MLDYKIYERIRNSKGMRDADVARIAQITPSTFTEWKKGEYTPKHDKIARIANVLGVSFSELVEPDVIINEQNFNSLFARNLRHYLEVNKISQIELSKKLNVGTTSVYNWCNGIKTPRMDKVDKMCQIFGCKRSDLITETRPAEYDAETQEFIHLFQNVSDEDRDTVMKILRNLQPRP